MRQYVMQYISDWVGLRGETCPIATRVDSKGGTYFWATMKESKAHLAEIKSQLKKDQFQNARFGGIYIPSRQVEKAVYEAFSKQCGYVISNWCRFGRLMDTPSPTFDQ